MHFIVRMEARSGKEALFREALRQVVESTLTETGCVTIRAFESIKEPVEFAIYSEWVDEAAFERHAHFPHTVQFLAAAEKLLTQPIKGLRAREIAGV